MKAIGSEIMREFQAAKRPILDHGYLTFIEHWGSDERIIEAARMSTDKGFLGWGPKHRCNTCGCLWRDNPPSASAPQGSWSLYDAKQLPGNCCDNAPMVLTQVPGDEQLLAYLYEHEHKTPFEMAGLVIEVQAPIFVFREWHRHRTQSYNELSARYTPLPNVNYVPSVERCVLPVDTKNRQAGTVKDADILTAAVADLWLKDLAAYQQLGQGLYERGLRLGFPKEIARGPVTVFRYSRMRACANLRNWLAFMTLRCDPAAQWEIRQYAWAVANLIKLQFPRTYELWANGQKRA